MSSPVPGRGPLPSLPSPPLSSVGGPDSLAAMGGSWKRGERVGTIRSGAEYSRGFRDPWRGEAKRCERRTGAGGSERRARGSPSPNQTRDTSGMVERTRGVHDDGEAASELGPTLTHRRACPDGQDGAGHARGPGTRPGLNSAADGPGVCDGSVEGGKRHRERGTHRCVGSAGRCLGMITASSRTVPTCRHHPNARDNFFDSTGHPSRPYRHFQGRRDGGSRRSPQRQW